MIRINLAPEQARRRGPSFSFPMPSFNLGVMFLLVYAITVGGVGVWWVTMRAIEASLNADVDRLTRELASLRATLGAGANVKGQLAEVKRRIAVLEELTRNQGRPVILMDSFIDTVPRDLWITSLEHRESVVKLSGTAYSTTVVSDFMSNLKASGKFKEVDIVVSRQALDKTPSLVTFEVTCKFEI